MKIVNKEFLPKNMEDTRTLNIWSSFLGLHPVPLEEPLQKTKPLIVEFKTELERLIANKDHSKDYILTYIDFRRFLKLRGYVKVEGLNETSTTYVRQEFNDVISYDWSNDTLTINDLYKGVVTNRYEFEDIIIRFGKGFYNNEWIKDDNERI